MGENLGKFGGNLGNSPHTWEDSKVFKNTNSTYSLENSKNAGKTEIKPHVQFTNKNK
jgi:hypothetical protein